MIKLIAFSNMRAKANDSENNLTDSTSAAISAIADNIHECRFVSSLGNTICGTDSAEASSCVFGNVLTELRKVASAHFVMGELDSAITKPKFLSLCDYATRYRACDVSDYRCIFLDTLNENGEIDDEQFDWLSRLLGKSHRPAVIFSSTPILVSESANSVKTIANSKELCCLIEKSCKVALVLQSGNTSDHIVSHGVPYVTLSPMHESSEPTFAKISVSSRRIDIKGFGNQESYSISNIANTDDTEKKKKKGIFSFLQK